MGERLLVFESVQLGSHSSMGFLRLIISVVSRGGVFGEGSLEKAKGGFVEI